MPVAEQIAVLFAAAEGLLDEVPTDRVAEVEAAVREAVRTDLKDLAERITGGEELTDADRQTLRETVEGLAAERKGD